MTSQYKMCNNAGTVDYAGYIGKAGSRVFCQSLFTESSFHIMTFTAKNGTWVWDPYNNGVMYQSKEVIRKSTSRISGISVTASIAGRKNIDCEIRLMDRVDAYIQAKFRKHYQRKVKVSDVNVATIQDVKDVAIFTSKIDDLFPEFITYFHSASMDRFLRSLIIYFQFYLQIYNKMLNRRQEAARKLRQPIVTQLENEDRDNLADLRSMVARDYAAILMGIGDAKRFHHMNNKNNDSLSDRDRRLFETFIFLATKVVWIALFRKNLPLIEKEINKILRTINFSPVEHSENPLLMTTPEEERVLLGKAFKNERRLLHRSPAIQEIICDTHSYKLLSIGINDIPGADERIRYLEIAYAAPEELLEDYGIAVGILGVQRKYLDTMLKPKEISTTVKRTSLMKIGEFKIPPKSSKRESANSDTLSSTPCKFQETEAAKNVRITQCKKWRKYVETGGLVTSGVEDVESVRTLKTSISLPA